VKNIKNIEGKGVSLFYRDEIQSRAEFYLAISALGFAVVVLIGWL